jgi:hypothetical protein
MGGASGGAVRETPSLSLSAYERPAAAANSNAKRTRPDAVRPCRSFVRGHLLGFFLAAFCRRSTSRITSSAARSRRMRSASIRTSLGSCHVAS